MNGNRFPRRRHEVMSDFSNKRPSSPPNSLGIVNDYSFNINRKRPASNLHPQDRYTPSNSEHQYPSRYTHSPSRTFVDDTSPSNANIITLPYSLLIPNELIGFLIGTGGSSIKEIEIASSAILYFEKSGRPSKTTSPSFSSNEATQNIPENSTSLEVNSQQTQKEDDDEGQADKILSIYGSQEQKNRAVSLILGRIRSVRTLQDSDEKDAIIIGLPLKSLPLLIGHRGATINGLTHRSGCDIIVQKNTPKNDQIKAVSIRSSHISGLVNCISLIYETFEDFIFQGKLKQDDFLLLKDEKSARYAREASAAATSEVMSSRRKFPHNSPANHPPFSNSEYTFFQQDRHISPRPNKRMMVNHSEPHHHRNHSSLPYQQDNSLKHFGREASPFSINHNEKINSHFRKDHDAHPPQHHISRNDDYEQFSNRIGHRSFHNIPDVGRGSEAKPSHRSMNEHRRNDYDNHQIIDNPKYDSKEDHLGMLPNGFITSSHKPSNPSNSLSPFSPNLRGHGRVPHHSQIGPMDGEGNLLNHPYGLHPTPFHIKFVISADTAAWVVGKKGDHIKEVKRHTGADILVSDLKNSIEGLESDERLLSISGSIQNKFRAFQTLISPMLSKNTNSNKPIRMLLPLKSVSFVIGYRGLTINQITHESMAEVNVEKNLLVDGDRPVTITGSPSSQLTASLLLFEKVEEFYNADIAAEKLHIPMISLNPKSPFQFSPSNSSSSHLPHRTEMNNPIDSSPHFFQ